MLIPGKTTAVSCSLVLMQISFIKWALKITNTQKQLWGKGYSSYSYYMKQCLVGIIISTVGCE